MTDAVICQATSHDMDGLLASMKAAEFQRGAKTCFEIRKLAACQYAE